MPVNYPATGGDRLIIMNNYIRYADNRFYTNGGPESAAKNQASDLPVHTRANSISIIVCSCDNDKFNAFIKNIASVFGQEVQVIRISDAHSIAEGYNRGIRQADGDIVVFCHDDIVLLNNNLAEILLEDLEQCDIVGVAGTSRLIEGLWISAGHPFVHGQVAHDGQRADTKYQLCVYGLGRDDAIVRGIQALDGLFVAAKRRVLKKIRFDENNFDGFHLYDLDFTYSAFLEKFQIIIDHRIHILHHSPGIFDNDWQRYRQRFNQKFAHVLSRARQNMLCIIKGLEFNSQKSLAAEMKDHARSCRVFIHKQNNMHGHPCRINTYDHGGHVSHVLGDKQMIPFENNQVNYIRIANVDLDEQELSDIFRVCRHGAIVEVRLDSAMPGAEGRFEKTGHGIPGLLDSCPQVLQFVGDNISQGAMIRRALQDVDEASKCIYFQVSKRHELSNQSC